MAKKTKEKIDIWRFGFVLFNKESMPAIGTKIKVQYSDGSEEYETWEGLPFSKSAAVMGLFYRVCDENKELESLQDVFFTIHNNIVQNDFTKVDKIIRFHIENTDHASTLKTILIVTKEHKHLIPIREKLIEKFEQITKSKIV